MTVTARTLLRTTLYSSTAGVLLGVPLLTCIPAGLRGQEAAIPTAVIRGQSPENNGALTRIFGARTTAPSNVSADLTDQPQAQPTTNGSMVSRMFGGGTPAPATGQISRTQMRAQAKFMRRNPYAARIMMMQQQQQMLQQQQEALQQDYEAEAVPEPDVFDSLSIDASEWADAPGRQITEQMPLNSDDKPWWQTGEKPANSRERQNVVEEPAPVAASTPAAVPSTAALPAAPVTAALLTATPVPVATAPADPFPTEPGLAPAVAAPSVTEALVPAPVAAAMRPSTPGAVEEWSLSFPETAPAATVTAPPAAVASPNMSDSPSAPATAVVPPAPEPFVPPEPTGVASVDLPTVPVESPPLGDADFIPPEPEAPLSALPPANTNELPTVPAAPQPPFAEPTFPAAPATPVVPVVPDQFLASPEPEFPEPSAAPPASEFPYEEAAPVQVAEQPAEVTDTPGTDSGSTPFTGLKLGETPAVPLLDSVVPPGGELAEPATAPALSADEFLPPQPLQSSGAPSHDVPLIQSAPPVSTEVVELPPEPAPIVSHDSRLSSEPGQSDSPIDQPALSDAPAASTLKRYSPADLGLQDSLEQSLEVPNPAPFIPPEPEDFGSQYSTPPQDYYVPGAPVDSGLTATPDAARAPAPTAELAPDITAWSPEMLPTAPETMQIPDPIVAPSTAKRLVATPQPSPQQTNSKLERISSRQGLNGFKGFCPVAIKDHRELIDARPEYSAVYNGRRYFFSSAASQAMFDSNPGDYAPAALGNDVVHLMLTGESRPGSLEHAVWFRSRLYMFSTAETMETFVASPSIHAWEE